MSDNLAVLAHLGDRVAIRYLGRLVGIAPADELFAHPNLACTQALLAEVPKAARRVYKPIADELRPALRKVAAGHISACHLNDG